MALYSLLHKGTVEKFLRAQPDPEQTRLELERFYDACTPVHGVRVGERFTVVESLRFYVFFTADVLWVYMQTVSAKAYGFVPAGTSRAVLLCPQEGAPYHVVVTQKGGEELIKHLFPYMPQAYFGYHDALTELWVKERGTSHPSLRALAALQHGKQ